MCKTRFPSVSVDHGHEIYAQHDPQNVVKSTQFICCGWMRLGCVFKLPLLLVILIPRPEAGAKLKSGRFVAVLWVCFQIIIAGWVLGAF